MRKIYKIFMSNHVTGNDDARIRKIDVAINDEIFEKCMKEKHIVEEIITQRKTMHEPVSSLMAAMFNDEVEKVPEKYVFVEMELYKALIMYMERENPDYESYGKIVLYACWLIEYYQQNDVDIEGVHFKGVNGEPSSIKPLVDGEATSLDKNTRWT